MADEKISQLDPVTDVLDDDDYVLARAGASKRITGASLKANLGGSSSFVRYDATLTWNDPDLEDGVKLCTPTIGDLIIGACVSFPETVFNNGTDPSIYFGTEVGKPDGFLSSGGFAGTFVLDSEVNATTLYTPYLSVVGGAVFVRVSTTDDIYCWLEGNDPPATEGQAICSIFVVPAAT